MFNRCLSCVKEDEEKSTVPEVRKSEVFCDVGVELAVIVISAFPLAVISITYNLRAIIRTEEIHSFITHPYPACKRPKSSNECQQHVNETL